MAKAKKTATKATAVDPMIEVRRVVSEIVKRLLDGRAADANTIAAQAARISVLEGAVPNTAPDRTALQAEASEITAALTAIGIE